MENKYCVSFCLCQKYHVYECLENEISLEDYESKTCARNSSAENKEFNEALLHKYETLDNLSDQMDLLFSEELPKNSSLMKDIDEQIKDYEANTESTIKTLTTCNEDPFPHSTPLENNKITGKIEECDETEIDIFDGLSLLFSEEIHYGKVKIIEKLSLPLKKDTSITNLSVDICTRTASLMKNDKHRSKMTSYHYAKKEFLETIENFDKAVKLTVRALNLKDNTGRLLKKAFVAMEFGIIDLGDLLEEYAYLVPEETFHLIAKTVNVISWAKAISKSSEKSSQKLCRKLTQVKQLAENLLSVIENSRLGKMTNLHYRINESEENNDGVRGNFRSVPEDDDLIYKNYTKEGSGFELIRAMLFIYEQFFLETDYFNFFTNITKILNDAEILMAYQVFNPIFVNKNEVCTLANFIKALTIQVTDMKRALMIKFIKIYKQQYNNDEASSVI